MMSAQSVQEKSLLAAESIQKKWKASPQFAIILGTGAGDLAEQIQTDLIIPYSDIPFFPQSTALGHKGELVCGSLAGEPVVAMRGRFHLYEGHPYDAATLPIHVFHQLGVKALFVSNASGGINPKFASGDVMAIDSHLDLMFRTSTLYGPNASQGRPLVRSDCYDPNMIEQAIACGRRHGFTVHQGIYAGMLGPNYETRAEYRFLRNVGADVAGMSTIHEVGIASQYGMRVLGLSVIANVAKPDVLETTSGQEVIDAAQVAGPKLQAIVIDAIKNSSNKWPLFSG